ncbi:MAG TPA: glycosyltransferase family 39 protein [Verrucomicrobiae bacterium]|nr:glycosyltransferase family 39 protein [Verrucomicrobiae bacterium]
MVAILTVLRFSLCGIVELLPEETYYWTYAQHPAFGYFDHPPMVAWIITVGTTLFGDTALGVRSVTFLLWVASAGLLFLTGRMWFGRRTALAATLFFTLLPIYVGMGLIVTPDAPLVFFWVATLYMMSKALHTGRGGYWLLAGVTFGGALLSKYYALLLAPSLLWFLLLSPNHRHWLRRPQPWLALPIALAVFSPVIIWNARHHWVSFLFQSTRTAGPQKNTLRNMSLFWLVQLAMLTPPFFALFAGAATRGIRRGWLQRDDHWNFVASFSLPLFFLFAAASFKTEIHVNWTAPAFLTLAIGGASILLEGLGYADPTRAKRWRAGAWGTIALCALAIVLGHTSLAWGFPRFLAYTHAGGWQATAQQVDAMRTRIRNETGKEPFVLGMEKYGAPEVGFYLHQPDECVNAYALGAPGLGYRYWTDLGKFEGRPAVVVFPKPPGNLLGQLRLHFDHVGEPEHSQVRAGGTRQRHMYLVSCTGYHAKEQPSSSSR